MFVGINCYAQTFDLQEEFFYAESFALNKQTDSAIIIWEKHANIPEFAFQLANYHIENKNYIQALAVCKKIDNSESYFIQARIYAAMGFVEEALSFLEKNLSSRDKKSYSKIMQCVEFEVINSTSEWKTFWQVQRYTKYEELIAEITYLLKIEDYDAALKMLEQSSRHGTEEQNFLYSQSYFGLGNYKLSEKFLTKCLEHNPNEPKYLHLQLAIYQQTNDYDKAYIVGRKLLAIEPYNSQNILLQAQICYQAKKLQEAENLTNKFLSYYNDNESAIVLSSRIATDSKNHLVALERLSQLIEINPSKCEYYLQRGEIYYANEMWILADYDFSMSLDIQPTVAEMNYKLGMTKYQLANYEKACYYWRRAATQKHKKAAEEFYKYCVKSE